MSDEEHAAEHGNLVVALQQLSAEVAALRDRVRRLEYGVRPSLVPPHKEPDLVPDRSLSKNFTLRRFFRGR